MNNVLIPNPLASDSEFRRYHCLDIADLETGDMLDELYALRPLLWRLAQTEWLRERVKALEGGLASRKYKK